MSACSWCDKDMASSAVVTCSGNQVVEYPDGQVLPSIAYEPHDRRCHDCNVGTGGKHHPGCDMERCPRCGGQLISCGCLDSEDAEDE